MRHALAAAAVALALVGGAHAAGSGTIGGRVVALPLDVSLALSASQTSLGVPVSVTATVTNLGTSSLSIVQVTLAADPNVAVSGGATRTLASLPGGSSATVTWKTCALALGGYVLLAKASAGGYQAESTGQLLQIAPGTTQCPEDASGSLPPGATLSTDAEGDGATAGDPVETAVTTPIAGAVSIQEQPSPVPATLPWQVQIEAPAATAAMPLRLMFELDASLLAGVDPLAIEISRDGLVVGTCPGDPCLDSRMLQADGDLELVVVSSAASLWTFGPTYPFAGFFAPVANPPAVNAVNAGRAVPIKFSLGGDRGLAIFAAGYPRSARIACDSAAVDLVADSVEASVSGLSYDPLAGQYVYVWKTDKLWAGTCRELVLRLVDGTEHRARFELR